MKKRYRTIAVALVVASGLVATIVSADEESDRTSLIREIDELLGSAAAELSSAESGSAGYVESARSRVQQVASKLSSLDRVKGSDSKAKDCLAISAVHRGVRSRCPTASRVEEHREIVVGASAELPRSRSPGPGTRAALRARERWRKDRGASSTRERCWW